MQKYCYSIVTSIVTTAFCNRFVTNIRIFCNTIATDSPKNFRPRKPPLSIRNRRFGTAALQC